MPGKHPADRVGIDLAVRLHRAEPGQLGGAVDLLQVDPDRAEEAERVGAERRAAGIDPAGAAQPELVAQRPVDQDLAERAQQPRARRHRLALGVAQFCARSATPRKIVEELALQPARIGRADHDRGQRVLPEARRRQRDRRAELAQVALHRLRLFREVAGEADQQMQRQREQRVADPRHRQIGEMLVARRGCPRPRQTPRPELSRLACDSITPLGRDGRAGGVGEQRQIVGLAGVDRGLDIARMRRAELAARLLHRLERFEDRLVVIAQPARIVVDDQLQMRQLGPAATGSCRPAPGPRRRPPRSRHGRAHRRARWRSRPGRPAPRCRRGYCAASCAK